MEIWIKEHGQTVLSVILSVFIIGMTTFTVYQLYNVMPIFKTYESGNNIKFIEEIKNYSPNIENEELIYIDYKDEFELRDYVSVTDYDGSSLNDRLKVSGLVDTYKKGLYTLNLTVKNDWGYSVKSTMNVIVE